MTDQPLVAFHPPAGLAFTAAPGALAEWFFAGALAIWALYTAVAIYHWLKYSHAASVAYPAITAHLIISATLVLYALSGLAPLL